MWVNGGNIYRMCLCHVNSVTSLICVGCSGKFCIGTVDFYQLLSKNLTKQIGYPKGVETGNR